MVSFHERCFYDPIRLLYLSRSRSLVAFIEGTCECLYHWLKVAVHDEVESVQCQSYAMVGCSVLRDVVRPYRAVRSSQSLLGFCFVCHGHYEFRREDAALLFCSWHPLNCEPSVWSRCTPRFRTVRRWEMAICGSVCHDRSAEEMYMAWHDLLEALVLSGPSRVTSRYSLIAGRDRTEAATVISAFLIKCGDCCRLSQDPTLSSTRSTVCFKNPSKPSGSRRCKHGLFV